MIKEPLRAVYGCNNNSHELLSWNGNTPPPRELLGLTDKPGGHITPKEKWWPAVNCGPVGDWWVLWCIEPDADAPRGGMVKSIAFLWDLNDIHELNDIQHYIYQLVNPKECKAPPPDLLMNVANELIYNSHILVIEAIESLPLIIARLWKNLWGDARKAFSIRVAFTPPQVLIGLRQPTLYCVPSSVVNQWYLPDVSLISSSTTTNGSRAASYLLDEIYDDSTLQEVLLCCGELTGDIRILSKIARTADNIDLYRKCSTLTNTILALRTVITCFPSSEHAIEIKNDLLASIKKLMVNSSDASDVLTMCNLSDDSIPQRNMPKAELSIWVENQFVSLNQDQLGKFLERAQPDKSTSWWLQAVVNGVRALVNNSTVSNKILFWLTMENFQRIFLGLSPVRNDLEQSLFENAINSDFSIESLRRLKNISIDKNWAKLHAWAALSIYDEEQVYEKQKNSMSNWTEGLPFLVENLSVQHAVNLLREKAFSPFTDLLVARTLKEPIILNLIDITEKESFQLWQKQLNSGGIFYPPSTEKRVFQQKLCSSLQSGLSPNIFEKIAEEISECLLSSEDRVQVWARLDSKECKLLAECISKALVSNPKILQYLSDSESYLINELKYNMERAVCADPTFLLSYMSQSISHDEKDILRWLKRTHSERWSAYAHKLGVIILNKQYKHVANGLYLSSYGLFSDTPFFKGAVDFCSELLNSTNAFWLLFYKGSLTKSHENEVIKQFSEISSNIAYGRLDYFWQKAGGALSKLKSNGTELDKWYYAAKEAQNGALNGGLKKFLDVLMDEYPNNRKLKEINYLILNAY